MPSSKLREESPRVPANERALFSAKIGERTHETRVSLLQKLNGNVRANFLQRELFRPEREAQREAEEGAAKIHARREGWEHAEASPPPRADGLIARSGCIMYPRVIARRVSASRREGQGSRAQLIFNCNPAGCNSAAPAFPPVTRRRT